MRERSANPCRRFRTPLSDPAISFRAFSHLALSSLKAKKKGSFLMVMIWLLPGVLRVWLPGPRLDTERRFGLWLQQQRKNYACTGA